MIAACRWHAHEILDARGRMWATGDSQLDQAHVRRAQEARLRMDALRLAPAALAELHRG